MGTADPSAPAPPRPAPAAGAAAALGLLLAINLFNYIDRQVLSAVLPRLQLDAAVFDPADPWLQFKLGLLTSAFLVSYTLLSPLFGWLGGGGRRWAVVGAGVVVWSLASGGSGLATGYVVLLLTRCLVGVGEAAYGPVAPAMLSDLYPVDRRGRILAYFYLAIPVGSALGFVVGGQIGEHFGWRWAFLVTFVGIVPGLLCFLMREPEPATGQPAADGPGYLAVLRELRATRSFWHLCAGMTCTTFMLGGVAAWAPTYIFQREARFAVTPAVLAELEAMRNTADEPVVPPPVLDKLRPLAADGEVTFPEFKAKLLAALSEAEVRQYGDRVFDAATAAGSATLGGISTIFGGIVVVGGLAATLAGAWLGEKARGRLTGGYFHVAGWTTVAAWPFFVGALFAPFPLAWGLLFVAIFGLFANTGPANTILANVARSPIRATAFAVNILVIHMLGDVISPPLIGLVADLKDLHTAFLLTSAFILAGGLLWVTGAPHLDADTAKAEAAEQGERGA